MKNFTVSWDPNNEPDLDHYVVYWGTTSKNYTNNSGNIGLTTQHTLILDETKSYYVAVTAVDSSGLESDFSSEINTGRPKAPVIKLLIKVEVIPVK